MWKLIILSTLLLSTVQLLPSKSIDQQKIVDEHNSIRKKLNIKPLLFSQDCANFAQKWAEKLAKQNNGLIHSDDSKYGENLYWYSASATEHQVIKAWASETKYFNSRRRKANSKNGHYTQMIWENTKYVGTGMAISKDGSEYWVCSYYPPGNWAGEKVYSN